MKAKDLAEILLRNPDFDVFVDDAEHGLDVARVDIYKVANVVRFVDGKLEELNYKYTYTSENLSEMKIRCMLFSVNKLPELFRLLKVDTDAQADKFEAAGNNASAKVWRNMNGTLASFIKLNVEAHMADLEMIRRLEAAPYSFVL